MRSSTTRSGWNRVAELDAARAVGRDLDREALAAEPGRDRARRSTRSSSMTRIVRAGDWAGRSPRAWATAPRIKTARADGTLGCGEIVQMPRAGAVSRRRRAGAAVVVVAVAAGTAVVVTAVVVAPVAGPDCCRRRLDRHRRGRRPCSASSSGVDRVSTSAWMSGVASASSSASIGRSRVSNPASNRRSTSACCPASNPPSTSACCPASKRRAPTGERSPDVDAVVCVQDAEVRGHGGRTGSEGQSDGAGDGECGTSMHDHYRTEPRAGRPSAG